LQILCISGAFMPIYTLYQNLAISNGRSDIYLWCNFGQVILLIGLIIVCHSLGMTYLVTAYSIFIILWLLIWHLATKRLSSIRILDILKDIMPFFIASVGVMAATYFMTMTITNIYLLIILRVIIAATLYFAIMKLAHVVILDECINFVKKKLKR